MLEYFQNRFMKNIIGLDKGTPKSIFKLAKTNGSFRNTIMIRLIKVIKKYKIHFNEQLNYIIL